MRRSVKRQRRERLFERRVVAFFGLLAVLGVLLLQRAEAQLTGWHVVNTIIDPDPVSGVLRYGLVANGTPVKEWIDTVQYATEADCLNSDRFDPLYAAAMFEMVDTTRNTAAVPIATRRVCKDFT